MAGLSIVLVSVRHQEEPYRVAAGLRLPEVRLPPLPLLLGTATTTTAPATTATRARPAETPARDTPAQSGGAGRLAFASERDGDLGIYLMASNGTGVTRLEDSRAADVSPVWATNVSRNTAKADTSAVGGPAATDYAHNWSSPG